MTIFEIIVISCLILIIIVLIYIANLAVMGKNEVYNYIDAIKKITKQLDEKDRLFDTITCQTKQVLDDNIEMFKMTFNDYSEMKKENDQLKKELEKLKKTYSMLENMCLRDSTGLKNKNDTN